MNKSLGFIKGVRHKVNIKKSVLSLYTLAYTWKRNFKNQYNGIQNFKYLEINLWKYM